MPNTGARTLLVDDDPTFRNLLEHILLDNGYQVLTAGSAAELLRQADGCDLILLDLGLPDEDGLVLLRRYRAQWRARVVVLSGRDDAESRLAALELGADEVLTKPFSPRELLLRLARLVERPAGRPGGAPAPVLCFGGWQLDLSGRHLWSPLGTEVCLSRGEFELLRALAEARGAVVARSRLEDLLPTRGDPHPGTLTVLMHRLRRKLAVDRADAPALETLPGIGYRLRPEAAARAWETRSAAGRATPHRVYGGAASAAHPSPATAAATVTAGTSPTAVT